MSVPQIELRKVSEPGPFMQMALRHFCELNPAFEPEPDWERNYFQTIQTNQDFSLCWIVADGMRAGFVLFGIEDHKFLPRRTGAIYELYVMPQHRRKGIARACAKRVIDELWKSSPSKIQLEVVEGNGAAAQLWKALGFKKVTERFALYPSIEGIQ